MLARTRPCSSTICSPRARKTDASLSARATPKLWASRAIARKKLAAVSANRNLVLFIRDLQGGSSRPFDAGEVERCARDVDFDRRLAVLELACDSVGALEISGNLTPRPFIHDFASHGISNIGHPVPTGR